LYVLPETETNNIQDLQNQRYIGILFPKERQRERGGERESATRARARARARARGKGKRKGKINGKRERERTKARAILFLNRLGQSGQSANSIVLERAV
jgi:hypothetical protein